MKKNNFLNNENGFALLTTLLLGTLSLGLIAMAFYMVISSTMLSGVEKRYSVQLDVAKGVSGYIMAEIYDLNVTCNGGTCSSNSTTSSTPPFSCDTNAQIDLDQNICIALGKPAACTGVSACYLSEDIFTPTIPLGNPDPPYTLYSVRVTSTNNIGENAIIDFVYRIE